MPRKSWPSARSSENTSRPRNWPGVWPAKPLSSKAIPETRQIRQGRPQTMNDVDTAHTAAPFKVGILTLSDRSAAGVRPDASGPNIREALQEQLNHAFDITVY